MKHLQEFEVFVGGLDKGATNEDLKEVFSAVGELAEVGLMMNPKAKKNKGFVFLHFATVEHANRVVTEMEIPVVSNVYIFLMLDKVQISAMFLFSIDNLLQVNGK
ncbi:hypothetical protein MKX01_037629 [Papaver californicum]|nr:hypothetical protein MKX01_037629 [Papaver californicum]